MDGARPIAMMNVYLHHLGTSADPTGLDRLNGRGRTGGGTDRERACRMTAAAVEMQSAAFPIRYGVSHLPLMSLTMRYEHLSSAA